jgi:hypothetical protein
MMLTRSLCCFRGISATAERKLWRAGCLSWADFARIGTRLSPRKAADLARQWPAAKAALAGRVADYFLTRLPVGCRTRVWPDVGAGMAFLDVETTGLGPRDAPAIFGIWQAGRLRQFVAGRDLEALLECWRGIEVLATFGGTRFDVPVVARTFRLSCRPPHIDLMHEARAYGYVGGLKAIERALGIRRSADEEGDGETAARLSRRWLEHGDAAALSRLLLYNARDVRTLPILAHRLLRRSFDAYPGPLPAWQDLLYIAS